jgi:hypothetical protein
MDDMMNRPMPPMAAKKGVAPKRPMPRRRVPPLPPEAGAGDVTPPPGAPGMPAMKKGGKVGYASGGSASKRADGCAQRGKTKGRMI